MGSGLLSIRPHCNRVIYILIPPTDLYHVSAEDDGKVCLLGESKGRTRDITVYSVTVSDVTSK